MSLGSKHDEEGMLLRDGQFLILRRAAGGRWRLEADREAERLVGRRVRVKGTRVGFDLLAVERLTAC